MGSILIGGKWYFDKWLDIQPDDIEPIEFCHFDCFYDKGSGCVDKLERMMKKDPRRVAQDVSASFASILESLDGAKKIPPRVFEFSMLEKEGWDGLGAARDLLLGAALDAGYSVMQSEDEYPYFEIYPRGTRDSVWSMSGDFSDEDIAVRAARAEIDGLSAKILASRKALTAADAAIDTLVLGLKGGATAAATASAIDGVREMVHKALEATASVAAHVDDEELAPRPRP